MNDDMDYGQDDQPTGVSGPLPDDATYEEPPARSRGRGGSGRGGSGRGRGRGRSGGSGGGDGRKRSSMSSGGSAALQKPAVRIGIAAVALVILIIIFTLVIQGCRRNQLEDSYKSYMGDVTTIATESGKEGDTLQQVLQNA